MPTNLTVYSPAERAILTRLAEVLIPAGERVPPGDARTVERLETHMAGLPALAQRVSRGMIWALEGAAVPLAGRPFSRLAHQARARMLTRLHQSPVPTVRHALKSLTAGLKAAHFDAPEVYTRFGHAYALPRVAAESPRWLAQATDGREVRADEVLECDVVVIGTGAGGAPLAYELARRGHAVLMLEEGRYFRRHEFNGRAAEMTRKMYRDGGVTVAFGNVSAPVWAGCTVGGTTTINSGTCFRAPERTFRAWREQHQLPMFSSDAMAGYYARAEHVLGVAPAGEAFLGGVARVIARGADALGYRHGPLHRNAPDCDGQGLCCFGCPTGAKRSTDVSYVPMALERGAALYASCRVERILLEPRGGAAGARRAEQPQRAVGVLARCAGGGQLTVRARAVVVACGALMTPMLLLANGGVANRSGMVGRNLSIHPASAVLARFDEPIEMHRAIPQGYAIEHFADEGFLFEGSSTPLDVTALALPLVGEALTRAMDRYDQLASFGYMIHDDSRGRVRRGPGGQMVITYTMNRGDARKMQRATCVLAEVFLAAGAVEVFPAVHGFSLLRSSADLARLRAARLAPGDFDVSAYHPLGTARMGADPRTSVVGPDHQCHDVEGLYVVDGAAVPSSLGVNPQMTIMAMSLRAAEILDARLGAGDAPAAHDGVTSATFAPAAAAAG